MLHVNYNVIIHFQKRGGGGVHEVGEGVGAPTGATHSCVEGHMGVSVCVGMQAHVEGVSAPKDQNPPCHIPHQVSPVSGPL